MPKFQDPTMPAPSDGVTPGDDRNYPDRGTSSGVKDTYGASLDLKAKNRLRGIHDACLSDSPYDNEPDGDQRDADD